MLIFHITGNTLEQPEIDIEMIQPGTINKTPSLFEQFIKSK